MSTACTDSLLRRLFVIVLISTFLSGCKLIFSAGPGGKVYLGADKSTLCDPDCQAETIDDGGDVYIAVPSPGYVFDRWEGPQEFCAESDGASDHCTIVPAGPVGKPALDALPISMTALFAPVAGASIYLSASPDQSVYGVGQKIDISMLLVDSHGSPIPGAPLTLTSVPQAGEQTDSQFVYHQGGIYTITATLPGGGGSGEPISTSIDIVVDGNGAAINCDFPIDGAILSQAPGDIVLSGSVADMSAGLSHFEVNNTPVAVDPTGGFSTMVPATWGVNFIQLMAVDGLGDESRRTCSFLLSEQWMPETRIQPGMISSVMRQAVFDDGNRSDPLDSAADILAASLNSSELRDELHSVLSGGGPLKASSCDQEVCVPVLGCACVVRSEVLYLNSRVEGPNSTSLSLIPGKLRSSTTVLGLGTRVRVRGHISGIGFDTSGWVTFATGSATMEITPGVVGGNLRGVGPSNVSTSVGAISTDFSGLDGLILDILNFLFNGLVRAEVSAVLRTEIVDKFGVILDALLNNLDIHNLTPQYTVPRLDGHGAVAINFTTDFTSVNTSTSRLLTVLGTQLQSKPTHARLSLGAPLANGAPSLAAGGSQPIASALNVAAIDQGLHALWRGGYFDLSLHEGNLAGFIPAGVKVDTRGGLPPATRLLANGRLQFSLGALRMSLMHPRLRSGPIALSAGARMSCVPSLAVASETLFMADCTVDELHFSHDGTVFWDAQTQMELEDMISGTISRMLIGAATNAFPVVPIPGIIIPPSLSSYGLPGGSEMRVANPQLRTEGNHIVLEGQFRVRE